MANLATFEGLGPNLVPTPVAQQILKRTQEQSVVARLAGTTPVPLEGAAIAVQTGHIEAGVVGEGEMKPVGSTAYGTKMIKPIKVAAIAVHSKELRMKNPVGMLENIQGDLSDAITRAFDLSVLYGLSSKTGAAIPGVESINQTTNRVTLGTAAQNKGGIAADLLAGYDLVENGDQVLADFSGFAFDRTMRSQLAGATDVQGRPLFSSSFDLGNIATQVMGLPATFARAVSGKVGASTDTGVRAFGGDWSAIKYGWAETMTMSTTDQATVVDGDQTYYLWQQNLEAVLVEAIFGWVITDPQSFVAYEQPKAA